MSENTAMGIGGVQEAAKVCPGGVRAHQAGGIMVGKVSDWKEPESSNNPKKITMIDV